MATTGLHAALRLPHGAFARSLSSGTRAPLGSPSGAACSFYRCWWLLHGRFIPLPTPARDGAASGPVVLMGHSFGGFLSLAQAIHRPDDVAALVLVAAGPGFRKSEARDQWNESVRASAAKMDQPPGVEEISMHHDSFVIDHLADVRCPVLVLLGERDKRFAASASLFERELDVGASVVVPDQGHMVHLKAAGACAAEVRRFLTSVFPTVT